MHWITLGYLVFLGLGCAAFGRSVWETVKLVRSSSQIEIADLESIPRDLLGRIQTRQAIGLGLEEEARDEIEQNWRFEPAKLDGKPVNVNATIEVQFALRDKSPKE